LCGGHATDGFHTRLNAAARSRDFRVGGSGETHFVIDQARPAEDQVRVAVDEARHDYAACGIDLFRAAGFGPLFDAALGTGVHYQAILY
jgi:hypothetical protein